MAQLESRGVSGPGPRAWQAAGRQSPPSETTGNTRRGARHGTSHQRQASSGSAAPSSQRPPRERVSLSPLLLTYSVAALVWDVWNVVLTTFRVIQPVSDSNNPYGGTNTNQTSSLPQRPPVASYTSEPVPPWINRGEGYFGLGAPNRDHAFPDQVPGTRGPAPGQPPVSEQLDQNIVSPYPGDNTFPDSSSSNHPGPGQRPQ